MENTVCKHCLQDISSTSFFSCEDPNNENCFFVNNEKERKDEIDQCVMCGDETPYTRSTHIDFRNFYVEGCGQLCKTCFQKTYQ